MAGRKKILKLSTLIILLIFAGESYAGTYSMMTFFADIPHVLRHCGCPDMPAPLYLATFSDNSTDNSTGTSSAGSLTLDIEGRTFDNETGTYMPYGNFFTGSWSSSEFDTAATVYWEQSVSIDYNFFFVGMFIFDDTMVLGSFFTTTRTNISDPVSGYAPFFGILVSD